MNERDIFPKARSIADQEQQKAWLADVCGDDEALLHRVSDLLRQDKTDDSLLDLPDTHISDGPDPNDLIQSGSVIGPYKLLERIGEGGFGVVFMAEQTHPIRRTVALKVIKPGMDTRQVIARFEAERQALAIMDHPGIAQVFDAGTMEQTGRPYFVMELVRGVPITTFCDQHRLTPRQRLELFVPVCQAIQHAHSKGIIHRDIKPGNVLVAMYDDKPVPKVIDFGVAKATGQRLTEQTVHTGFGAVVGSIEYMSPEQASFNQLDVDTRSDVYALGILLYELLAGSPPLNRSELEQAGLMESLRVIRESDPVTLSTRLITAEGLPTLAANRATDPARLTAMLRGELDWIVMKALEKDRNRRYETVNGFADDVQRYLVGDPILAHPPNLAYRLRKFIVKNRVSVAAAALLATGLVMATFLTAWSIWQREQQLDAHSELVSAAIEECSLALGIAANARIGSESEWAAARTSRSRIVDLLKAARVDTSTKVRANEFLTQFDERDEDRQLAEQIEDVVIVNATHDDRESWERMERRFRELFRDRGIDLDTLPPREVAKRIRTDRSAARLSEALELWIGTRGQLATLGGPRLNATIMQPWAEAMYAADQDPVRNGIRRLIYSGRPPSPDDVEAVIRDVDLTALSPRTLSWLATVFDIAGATDRADDVMYLAVRHHPSDCMLNHDFAWMLYNQERWQGAIRFYMRCTAIRPDVSGLWRGLGNALRANDELVRSADALQQAAALEPDHAAIHVDLAATQLALGSTAEAEASAQRAVTLGTSDARAFNYLGQALFQTDRIAESLVAFERCSKLLESNSEDPTDVKQWIDKCRQRLAGIEPELSDGSE